MESELLEVIGYGAVGSILATIIWQVLGKLSSRIRTPLEYLTGYFGGGVMRTFKDFNDAAQYVDKGLRKSKEVKFLAIRGFLITHEENAVGQVFARYFTNKSDTKLKVMLANPDGPYAAERAAEFEAIRKESASYYLAQIRTSVDAINSMKTNLTPHLEMRLHDTPAIFRIMVFDEYCLISFYSKEFTGLNSPVLLVSNQSALYKSYDRYFDACWEASQE